MHIRREGQLTVLCSRVLGRSRPDTLAPLEVEHHPEQHELQSLLHGLRHDQPVANGTVRESLDRLAAWLRRHMSEQEQGLFPFLEQVFWGRREAVDATRLNVVRRWTEGRSRLHATKP
jgi:hemerythrin-like domain-containing protein